MKVAGNGLNSIAISSLGDFCVMGGDSFITVLTQDSNLDSFTQNMYYSKA